MWYAGIILLGAKNPMFGREICDKLSKCIFQKFSKFSKFLRVIYPKNCPNETCGYWLITPNQQMICIETNIAAGNYKSASGQLQNNSVNGAILITIHHVIMKTSSYEVIATRLDKWNSRWCMFTYSCFTLFCFLT